MAFLNDKFLMMMRILHLGKQIGWFSLLWLMTIAPAQAERLRVAVAQKISQVNLAASTPAIVSDGNGQKFAELQPLKALLATASRDEIEFGDLQVTLQQQRRHLQRVFVIDKSIH